MSKISFDMYFLEVQQLPASLGTLVKIAVGSDNDIWGLALATIDNKKTTIPVRLIGDPKSPGNATWKAIPLPEKTLQAAVEIQCASEGLMVVQAYEGHDLHSTFYMWVEDAQCWTEISTILFADFAIAAAGQFYYTSYGQVYELFGQSTDKAITSGKIEFDKVLAASDGTVIASERWQGKLYKLIDGEEVLMDISIPNDDFYQHMALASASQMYLVSQNYIIHYAGEGLYQEITPSFYTYKKVKEKNKKTGKVEYHYKYVKDPITTANIKDIRSCPDIPLSILAENSEKVNTFFIQVPFPPKYHGVPN